MRRWWLTAALLALVGCSTPALVWGPPAEGEEATLRFEGSFVGTTATRRLEVRNQGGRPAQVVFRRPAGDVGFVAGPSFSLALEPPNPTLAPGQAAEVVVTFTPRPITANLAEVITYAGQVELVDPTAEERPLRLVLEGSAAPAGCAVPGEVDFGPIQRGAVKQLDLRLSNPSPLPQLAEWTDAVGDQSDAFSWGQGAGVAELAPGGTSTLSLTFSPSRLGAYRATARVRAAQQCPWRSVELKGEAVDTFLVLEPPQLDCGFVDLERGKVVALTVRNTTTQPVIVSGERRAVPGFSLAFGSASGFSIPRQGSATFEVECRPTDVGLATGELILETSLALQPELTLKVRAVGGIPQVLTQGNALLFDEPNEVKLVDGLPPSRERLGLVIAHREASPRTMRSIRELEVRLGRFDDAGVLLDAPFYELLPGPGTDAGDFRLDVAPGPYPFPLSAGSSIVLEVTATASTPGPREARLIIHTSAAASRRLEVTLFAEANRYSACRLGGPTGWDLGMVLPGTQVRRDNPLVNLGTGPADVCFLGPPERTNPFSFVAGRAFRLGPGASVPFPILFDARRAPTDADLRSRLSLAVSNPSTPVVGLDVVGRVGQTCLAPAPVADRLPVPQGCVWRGAVNVTNECDVDVPFGPLRLEPGCGAPEVCGAYQLVPPTPLDGGVLRAGQSMPLAIQYLGSPGEAVSLFTSVSDGGLRGLSLGSRDTGDRRAPVRLPEERNALVVVSRSQHRQPPEVYRAVADALAEAADAGVAFNVAVVRGEWDVGVNPDAAVPAREPLGVYVVPQDDLVPTVSMRGPEARDRLLARLELAAQLGGPGGNSTDICLEAARQVALQPLNGPPLDFQVVLCLTGDGDSSTPRRSFADRPDGGIERGYYLERLEKLTVHGVVGNCERDAGSSGLEEVAAARLGRVFPACQAEAALRGQVRDALLQWRWRWPLPGYGPSSSVLMRLEEERFRPDAGLEYFTVSGWTYLPELHALDLPPWPADAGRLFTTHALVCPP